MTEIDVGAIHAVREFLRAALGKRLAGLWSETYRALRTREPYRFDEVERTLGPLRYRLSGPA